MVAAFRPKALRNRRAISAACLCIAILALGAAPTSQPSAQQIRTWFNQLADSDSSIRDKAVENLMGISNEDLPTLRKIVEDTHPLLPSQKIVLRDIVTQVFLSATPFEPTDVPFIGMSWSVAFDSEDVIVATRIIGFDSYRMLRDGDIIKTIHGSAGDISVSGKTNEEPQEGRTRFSQAVKIFHAGETIQLRVVRDGQEMIVPILLRPRPAALPEVNADVTSWSTERDHAADEYWTQWFAALVGDDLL